MSKLDELKKINAQKKVLAEEAKTLRGQLDATKEERKEARKAQAEARKDVRDQKASLRDLSAKIYETFSSGDAEAVAKLADDITESAAVLAATVRKFADASKDPEAEVETDEEL